MSEFIVLLIGFFFSGAACLMYEITLTRAFGIVIGSTTYSLSMVLAVFMIGIGLGGFIGGYLIKYKKYLCHKLYIFSELGLTIIGIFQIRLIYKTNVIYAKIYYAIDSSLSYYLLSFVFTLLILALPTILMGITFPAIAHFVVKDKEDTGFKVGLLYLANSVGAGMGALLSGFLLIGLLGINNTSILAGFFNFIAFASMAAVVKGYKKNIYILLLILASASILSGGFVSPGYSFNLYNYNRYDSMETLKKDVNSLDRIYSVITPYGPVEVYMNKKVGEPRLIQAGRLEGSTSTLDFTVRMLTVYTGISFKDVYTPDGIINQTGDCLVIGLGTGTTVYYLKQSRETVSCVEINPGIIDAVDKNFYYNQSKSGIKLYYDDALHFMYLNKKKYDLIFSEPSYPSESVTGNLFTIEFYKLINNGLKEDGIFVQWIPYFLFNTDFIDKNLKTFNTVFKHIRVYNLYDSILLFIGSQKEFKVSDEQIFGKLSRICGFDVEKVMKRVVSREKAEAVMNDDNIGVLTLDRPEIEYQSTKHFFQKRDK